MARNAEVVIAGAGFRTLENIRATSEMYWEVGIALVIVIVLDEVFTVEV